MMKFFKRKKENETKRYTNFGVKKEDINKLEHFKSRDGFCLLEESDFDEMLEYFEQYEVYKNLIPIMTDNNSNYWCLYVSGILKGMVCYLSHDGPSLEPKFKDIPKFINAINKNPDAYDFDELDITTFDYPTKENEIDLDNRQEIISGLFTELEPIPEDKEDIRQQLAFSLMALVKSEEIESYVYTFLEDKDMYIQEKAIETIGFHKYTPARDKLIELTKTAMVNGKSAAGKALKELKKNKYGS